MLEGNFSPSNGQSLEYVDENFPSQKLLLAEPILDNYKCDSTQMVLIDPYEVYLENTFEESHQLNNSPFGVLCEGSGGPLELDDFNYGLKSVDILSSSFESHLHSLPKFSSSFCCSFTHFLPQSSPTFSLIDDAIISFRSHIYISTLEHWIEQSCTPTSNPSHHTFLSFFHSWILIN